MEFDLLDPVYDEEETEEYTNPKTPEWTEEEEPLYFKPYSWNPNWAFTTIGLVPVNPKTGKMLKEPFENE